MKDSEEKQPSVLSIPAAILIGSVLISISILISGGVLRTKSSSSNVVAGASNAPQPSPTEDNRPVKVSVDDDAVLGDKNAKVTLIEFSDYECPFCKRHFEQTFPQLKKDYIDTGKVKLVFRDLPLPFHDPNATDQAMAASCAREQGGDATYYKFHTEIFKRTASNKGLDKSVLPKIATDLGLNVTNFNSCLDSGKYKAEVSKDLQDGNAVGANGTPTFFVGLSTADGLIEGTRIVGAQPYSAFKTQIDALLD